MALMAVCRSWEVQGSTNEWSLGCVNSRPVARGSQEAGFTQPTDHFLADPCMYFCRGSQISDRRPPLQTPLIYSCSFYHIVIAIALELPSRTQLAHIVYEMEVFKLRPPKRRSGDHRGRNSRTVRSREDRGGQRPEHT